MSVLVPDKKVFQYVQQGFAYAANNKVYDEKFSYTVLAHCRNVPDWWKESERWTRNLITLNCKSYSSRYREPLNDDSKYFKSANITISAVQLLKYLNCIRYNIEVNKDGTISNGNAPAYKLSEQDQKDFDLLNRFIDDLKESIIGRMPEYETAKWSD